MHLNNLYSKFDYSTNPELGTNIAFYIKKISCSTNGATENNMYKNK